MTREEFTAVMNDLYKNIYELHLKGSKEYAHREDDVFANFKRVGERIHTDPKKVLMVYFEKHIDGIHSYINGYKSQREDVTGRIQDAIVYLFILYGLILEERKAEGVK